MNQREALEEIKRQAIQNHHWDIDVFFKNGIICGDDIAEAAFHAMAMHATVADIAPNNASESLAQKVGFAVLKYLVNDFNEAIDAMTDDEVEPPHWMELAKENAELEKFESKRQGD